VRGSGDPARARELVAAHPESGALVRDLYLEELARRGRVKQLIAAAHTLGGADRAALELAIWGRPLAALELAATAHHQTPELVCARALACYRAGRPDLTDRILVEDLPPPSITGDEALPPFPGPHEQWMIQHAPAASPAIAALASGRDAIVALAQLAPHDAEPDPPTIESLAAVVHRLGRGLAGRTVYLAGEFKQPSRDKLEAALAAAGARLVAGPAPGTDFYVPGDGCSAETVARLERQGVRRLRELEEVGK
jgi:NAD-dependent DNA ligase